MEQCASRQWYQCGRSARGPHAVFGESGQQLHRREAARNTCRFILIDFRCLPRSASRGWKIQQHETIVVTYPQAVESKHWHGTVSIRSDELPGQIEEPRLERAPRCRGTMQGCQPRLSVRRLERVPVVSAIVPAREPVEAPGSR